MREMILAVAQHGDAPGHGGALFVIPGIGLEVTSRVTTMWGIMAVIILFGWLVTRGLKQIPESRLQNGVEMALEGLMSILNSIMHENQARRFLPFLGSLFIFILVSNYSGLLPGAGELPGFNPPTNTWSVTAGLAIIVFVVVHFFGIKEKGLGYFKHFVEPLFLAPLMLPLSILEELVKPFSLSLRLYANIFAGEAVLLGLLFALPYFLPISVLLLEVIFGFVQAFIFTTLATVYIANATSEAEH